MLDPDASIRSAAFEYLAWLTGSDSEVPVNWPDLIAFTYDGQKCPLIGQRGIWKPSLLELPISLATAPPKPGRSAPYEDQILSNDTVVYRYQGQDPHAHDNVWLHRLFETQRPVIYFHGIDKGVYLAVWPAYVVADHPDRLAVTIDLNAVSASANRVAEPGVVAVEPKRYIYVPARQRLHQHRFRNRVMRAYQKRCAICRIGHERLLDAAHIIPDFEAKSTTSVSNGLSLCKIHHAAFDQNIVGIDPDLIVHVRNDILDEQDGPMLRHGIQEMHRQRLRVVPKSEGDRPSRDGLEERFARFRSA